MPLSPQSRLCFFADANLKRIPGIARGAGRPQSPGVRDAGRALPNLAGTRPPRASLGQGRDLDLSLGFVGSLVLIWKMKLLIDNLDSFTGILRPNFA